MEGIFTLPYSEYEVINQLQKNMTKSEWYSFYIPTSRQQKGIDFLIHNNKTNKVLRIQVKSSRSYVAKPKELKSGKIKDIKYKYHLWFNNFLDKYPKGNADYYILFGLYPLYESDQNMDSRVISWKSLILCFSEEEMFDYLKQIKTKKESKKDSFFGFGFNKWDEIYWTRWLIIDQDKSNFLLKNKLIELKK